MFQIAETYAFLPREAVTRFLMSCADCQKRMHLSLEVGEEADLPAYPGDGEAASYRADSAVSAYRGGGGDCDTAVYPDFDLSMPITTAYINLMRNKGSESPGMGSGFYRRDDCDTPEVGVFFFFFAANTQRSGNVTITLHIGCKMLVSICDFPDVEGV